MSSHQRLRIYSHVGRCRCRLTLPLPGARRLARSPARHHGLGLQRAGRRRAEGSESGSHSGGFHYKAAPTHCPHAKV